MNVVGSVMNERKYGKEKTRNNLLLVSSLKDIVAFSSTFSRPKRMKLRKVESVRIKASIVNTIRTGTASAYFTCKSVKKESGSANTPATIGMANMRIIFKEVSTSSVFLSVSSFGYSAKARNEEYVMIIAICLAAPKYPLASSLP